MNTDSPTPDTFDGQQSLEIIKEMILVSRRKIQNDGILILSWGWIMLTHYFILYLLRVSFLSFQIQDILNLIANLLPLAGLTITVIYLFNQSKRVQTYMGTSLRYVWISAFVCMVLVNLIQFNVMQKINFELQHPIYMVIIAFAIVISGGIIRYKLLVIGGICFGLLAYLSSFLALPDQLLVEAFAWLIAFIIPGHLLYAKRKR